MVQIVPSILSADFARLGEEIHKVEQGGATMLHVDIMDGHFVPNLTIGPPVVRSVRAITKMTLDVHLMVSDPDKYAPIFIEAGADQVLVHQEAARHLDGTLRSIQSEGIPAGVVLNPSTPVAMLDDVLGLVDYGLIMSVSPGFGGQEFIPHSLEKVRQLARRRTELGLGFAIEIDGGVNLENLADIVRAGVDWVVSGASIFKSPDPAATGAHMREMALNAAAVRV